MLPDKNTLCSFIAYNYIIYSIIPAVTGGYITGRDFMNRLFNPEQLYIDFREGVTTTQPLIGRKYTLTHSDKTGELFLTIGLKFAYDKISNMRDEVLAEWREDSNSDYLFVYIYLDSQADSDVTAKRDKIFRQELPMALQAIRYGEQRLFDARPDLDEAQIWIMFDSTDPELNRYDYYGTFAEYKEGS